MKAVLRWLQAGDEPEAHFCAVEGSKAAAICGYATAAKWHRPLNDMMSCERCDFIERSGEPINFRMPDGSVVEVRGRVGAH